MVDIVMAVYNGERYLAEQIDSILQQSYRDIRLYIRDDGSADRSAQIIDSYAQRCPERVIAVRDTQTAGSACRNFMLLLQHTTADYVMFSDQDDVWLPDKVRHSLEQMEEIEQRIGADKPVLVFGSYRPVDEHLNAIHDRAGDRQEAAYKLAFSNLLVQNYVNGNLMMANRTLVRQMGTYADGILMHDWWAALLAAGGGEIRHIDEEMLLYRQHAGNVVGSKNIKSLRYRISKLLDPETKNAAALCRRQAMLLYRRNRADLSSKHRAELRQYLQLFRKGKFGRIRTLLTGGYLKSDPVRILSQLFYI